MIWTILGLGRTLISSNSLLAIIATGLIGFVIAFGWQQQTIGKQKVVRASVKEGIRKNARAEKIRQKIYSGTGSVGALPCRDCD